MTKWFRVGGWSNIVLPIENAQVNWRQNEFLDSDGFAVISADGSSENYPACFQYFSFMHENNNPFVVIGIYSEKEENGSNEILLPMIGFRDKNGITWWLSSSVLPMEREIKIDGRIFVGHFISFFLEPLFSLEDTFIAEKISFFIRAPSVVLIDYVCFLTFDDINLDVWNGNRAAVWKFLNAEAPIDGYFLPPFEILKEFSGGEMNVINPVGYPFLE